MNEPTQNKVGDNSPSANATANVGVGLFLAIAGFGIACVALGMELTQPRITEAKIEAVRAELIGKIESQKAEIEVYKDKATVSENHWRNIEVKQGVMEEKINGRR